jgi:hypothetical protein
MDSRYAGTRQTAMPMPQEKLLLGRGKVGVTSIKDAASPHSFVSGGKGKTMCTKTHFSINTLAQWENRKVSTTVRSI